MPTLQIANDPFLLRLHPRMRLSDGSTRLRLNRSNQLIFPRQFVNVRQKVVKNEWIATREREWKTFMTLHLSFKLLVSLSRRVKLLTQIFNGSRDFLFRCEFGTRKSMRKLLSEQVETKIGRYFLFGLALKQRKVAVKNFDVFRVSCHK